jgi:hypothetical protein
VTTAVEQQPGELADADVISLTIPAAMRFVRLVRIGIASLARRKGLSVRAIDDLRLAVDETFSLLLHDEDHAGSVDITFEVDDHELLVNVAQRLTDGPLHTEADQLVRFDVVLVDLVDRFDTDLDVGVVQFTKRL